jgi:thymidylate synthase ThyX
MLARVERDMPVAPLEYGQEARGMQSAGSVPPHIENAAARVWSDARKDACHHARRLNELGIHKQVINRLLEPFATITVLLSSTEWDNFFTLRCHEAAQPEMQKVACMIRDARRASVPSDPARVTGRGSGWHLPFITNQDANEVKSRRDLIMISAARCARVSYLNHEGTRDLNKDMILAATLADDGHWSPFEHVARPQGFWEFWTGKNLANYRGWVQLRKILEKKLDIN